MFPISEPISNYFLLSLLILIPGILALKYLPWHKIDDAHFSMSNHQLSLKRSSLIRSSELLIAILTVFISLSIFSLGLSQGQGWLRFIYLFFVLLIFGLAIRKKVEF